MRPRRSEGHASVKLQRVDPFRPKLGRTELIDSFASRLIDQYGLSRTAYGDIVSQAAPALVCLGTHVANSHEVVRADKGSRYGQLSIPKWALRGGVAVCPRCLRESGVIDMSSRLMWVDVCRRHQINLVHRCHACKGRLSPQAAMGWTCRCGELSPVLGNAESAASPQATEVVERVWGRVVTNGPDASADDLAFSVVTSFLIGRLARQRRGRDMPFMGLPWSEYVARWLRHNGLTPPRCQGDLLELMVALREPIHSATAVESLGKLITQEAQRPTVLSRLPLLQWQKELLAGGAPPKRTRSMGLQASTRQRSLGLTPFEIARLTGSPYSSIVPAMTALGCTPAVVQVGRVNYRYYQLDDVERAKAILVRTDREPGVSSQDLGLSRTILRRWRLLGILRSKGSGTAAISVASVQSFLCALEAHACVRSPMPGALNILDDRLWAQSHGGALRQFANQLILGAVPLVKQPGVEGLRSLWVEVEGVIALKRMNLQAYRAAAPSCQMSLI